MHTALNRLALSGALVLSAAALACGGNDLTLPKDRTAAKIAIVKGNNQSGTVGVVLPDSVIVRVTDAQDRPVDGQQVVFAVLSGGGSVAPPSALTNSNGVTGARWVLGSGAGAQTLTATATGSGAPAALTATFTASGGAGAAATLALVSGNAQTAVAGSPLPDSLVVRVTDAASNPVPGLAVTWAADGGGSVSAPSTPTGADGRAAIRRILGPAAGPQSTIATVAGLSGSPITFTATATVGSAGQLTITTQPSSTAASGAAFATQPRVQLRDAVGNPVATAGIAISAAIASGPVGGALVGSSTVGTNVGGLATFAGLGISGPAGTYFLNFSGPSISGVTSSGIAVAAGAPTRVVFTVGPSNVAAGGTIAPAVKVAVEDADGNVATGATNTVTLALATNPGGAVLSGTKSVAAAAGVATFSNLSLDKAGAGYTLVATSGALTSSTSASFDVSSGGASGVAFTVQPSNVVAGVAISPAVTITIEDATGNIVPGATDNVTLAIGSNPGGSTLGGTRTVAAVGGVATFSTLTLDRSGAGYTLTAASGSLTGASSGTFSVSAAAASQLVFIQQPTSTVAGSIIAPPVGVALTDGFGNVVTAGGGTPVTIALGARPPGSTLSGTLTRTTVSGVASFGNLSINTAAPGYTLTATGGGFGPVTSALFDISTGSGNTLVFTAQPSDAVVGATLTPAVQVTIQDAGGNTVGSATTAVTLSLAPNASSLGGTTTVNASAGVATFADLSVGRAGTGYKLTANGSGLVAAVSSVFNVAKAATTTSVTGASPGTAVVGQPYSVSFTVVPVAPGAGAPTGSVTVSDGSASCTAPVAAGACTLTSTTAGTKTLTGTYPGDANFSASSEGTPPSYIVGGANTQLTINTDNPDPSTVGEIVHVTYSLTVVTPGGGAPGGTVTVTDGATSCTGPASATGSCDIVLSTASPARTLTATYAANANYNGSTDTEAHAVIVANAAPTAVADGPYTTDEDTPLAVGSASGVLANDTDPDSDPLTAELVTNVANGTLALNANGSFTYTPNANFNGSDSFTYHAKDPTHTSNTVTVSITVNAVNDAPTVTLGPNQTSATSTGMATVPAFASFNPGPADEAGQTLVGYTVTPAAGNAAALLAGPFIDTAGVLTYTTDTAFVGAPVTLTFTVTGQDSGGVANGGVDTSAPQTFTITITP